MANLPGCLAKQKWKSSHSSNHAINTDLANYLLAVQTLYTQKLFTFYRNFLCQLGF